jgi:hypothetical protein
LRSTAGVTLVELLVATALGLVGVATVLSFNRAQFFALRDQATQLDIQTSTRAIVDLFAREVRRAGRDPACTKIFAALVSGSASQVHIQEDLNSNGVLDAATEDLTYRIVNSRRIERVAGTTVDVLIDGVDLTGSRIRYFDGGGAELLPSPTLSAAQLAGARRVRLELAAAGTSFGSTRSTALVARAATDVELRNRFFIATDSCP